MALIRYQKPDATWDQPLRNLSSLRDEMDQLFERVFQSPWDGIQPTQWMGNWAPVVDLYEEKDNLIAKAEIPGMKKDEIEITLHDDVLSISGERKIEHKAEASENYRCERFEGRFNRSFVLPAKVNVDEITANYNDGILTVTLPKAEEAKAKQIPVSVK
jgi:HSP20 family protein